jgi:hypothetical protein
MRIISQPGDRAVCEVCPWEGNESDIEYTGPDGDVCPECGRDTINYFFEHEQEETS